MRKQLLNLKFLLMLCMIFCIGGGSVAFAEEETVTSTFTDMNWSVATGEPTWTNTGAATKSFESANLSRGVQIMLDDIKSSGLSLTNTTIKDLGNITSVSLVVSSNGTGGSISSVKVGETSLKCGTSTSYTVSKTNGQTATFTTSENVTGDIVISFSSTATSKSLYVKSISVTYSTGSTSTATLTGISVTGTAADLWKGDEFTHEGITVTATYDDGATADVTNSCEYSGYDMSTTGEQSVTVTYGEKTAEYTVNVKTIGNTKETAYTATEAIALIDAGKGLKTPVYVKGIVSNIAIAFNSQYGNISFDISADGTTEGDQFQFFRNFKGAGEEKYTSEDECPKVGDEVIGYGTLTKYNTTYEFDAGNYLVEKIVSTDPSSELTLSQTTGEVNVGKNLDIHGFVSTATGYTETVTYAVTAGSEYASVNTEGVITGLAVGTATIKVTAPAVVGSFSESSAEFTVTVVENRTATTVTFGAEVDDQTFNVNLGETFEGKTATVSPAEAGNVTYSSDKPEVASVDENGAITIGSKAGTATITASFAATDTHLASSAKYYITVADPNGPVFYESFDTNEGTGGNDDSWSGSIASNKIQSDITGWTFTKGYGADQCAKFGTKDSHGSAVTPAIDLSGDKYVLTFRAGTWDQDAETITVSVDNGSLTYGGNVAVSQVVTLTNASFSDYTMIITGATNSTKITFTANQDSKNRFFLDEVKIVPAATPATSTLNLIAVDNDIYYATFSSSEDVIFPSDVEVDAVSVVGTKLSIKELYKDDYFVKATSSDGLDVVSNAYYVPANTGVLIQSLTDNVTYYYPYESATVTLPENQLKPAPAAGGKFTAEDDYVYYKLAYNDYSAKTGLGFYWGVENGGAFSVKAGTAYLAVPTSETTNVKGFLFDGTTTGISAVGAEGTAKINEIYNIAGQKVNAMTKAGLYIVNGKKMVIKK